MVCSPADVPSLPASPVVGDVPVLVVPGLFALPELAVCEPVLADWEEPRLKNCIAAKPITPIKTKAPSAIGRIFFRSNEDADAKTGLELDPF